MHKKIKIGDHVYLRLNPRKKFLNLGICAKMAQRYCGTFEFLDRIGPVAYSISFPVNIRDHNVFHLSLLKKYVHDPNHIIDWNVIHMEPEEEF